VFAGTREDLRRCASEAWNTTWMGALALILEESVLTNLERLLDLRVARGELRDDVPVLYCTVIALRMDVSY